MTLRPLAPLLRRRRPSLLASGLLSAALAPLPVSAQIGPFVLGGDDLTCHGHVDLFATVGPWSGMTVVESEPNDAPATAQPVAIGDDWAILGATFATDVDFASFTGQAGQTVTATAVPLLSAPLTTLTLFDTDGTTPLQSVPAGLDIEVVLPADGTYYLAFEMQAFGVLPNYTLRLRDTGSAVEEGWLYIQEALELVASAVTKPNDGRVAVLGSAESDATEFDAGAAYYHAVPLAAVDSPLSGVVTFVDGSAAIQQFLQDLASGAEQPAVVVTAGTGAENDLDLDEGNALAANASALAGFVFAGGGLLAHGDDGTSAPGAAYGWLSALVPGASAPSGCNAPSLTLTALGVATLGGLGPDELQAGPCHNHFLNHGLPVLARDLAKQGPPSGLVVQETEPNDQFTEADSIAIGDDYQGSLGPNDFVDTVSFTASVGDAIVALGGPSMILYDGGVTQVLGVGFTDPLGLDDPLIHVFETSGTFLLQVAGHDFEPIDYTLELREAEPRDILLGQVPGGDWQDLGRALAGAFGEPELAGTGLLSPGTPFDLGLAGAAADTPGFWVAGPLNVDLPLLGGTLVPAPDIVVGFVSTAAGTASVGGTWGSGAPAGAQLFVQAWLLDPSGPESVTASNGLVGTGS